MGSITKIPNKDLYRLDYKTYNSTVRSLTGADIIYFAELKLSVETIVGITSIYNHLLVGQNQELEELDLDDFEAVIKLFFRGVLEKYLLKPENWLEVIYVISGRKFEPNWKDWANEPVENLVAMLQIAKRLERPIL
jgi:hypothetical protein